MGKENVDMGESNQSDDLNSKGPNTIWFYLDKILHRPLEEKGNPEETDERIRRQAKELQEEIEATRKLYEKS